MIECSDVLKARLDTSAASNVGARTESPVAKQQGVVPTAAGLGTGDQDASSVSPH